MDTVLTFVTDTIIVVTFPLHCRFLFVMLRNDAQSSFLDYSFRAALTNIGKNRALRISKTLNFDSVAANLLYSIVFILIQEPAAYGIYTDFYKVSN